MKAKKKEKPIILSWKEDGEWESKEISRKEIVELMETIKKSFDGNNEISTRLCQVLPNTIIIEIDKDRNIEKPEAPTIFCIDYEGNHPITIKNNHRIIWGILNEYSRK